MRYIGVEHRLFDIIANGIDNPTSFTFEDEGIFSYHDDTTRVQTEFDYQEGEAIPRQRGRFRDPVPPWFQYVVPCYVNNDDMRGYAPEEFADEIARVFVTVNTHTKEASFHAIDFHLDPGDDRRPDQSLVMPSAAFYIGKALAFWFTLDDRRDEWTVYGKLEPHNARPGDVLTLVREHLAHDVDAVVQQQPRDGSVSVTWQEPREEFNADERMYEPR